MSKKSAIKMAVVGVGSMGNGHLKMTKDMENVNITAICDIDEAKLKEKSEEWGKKGYKDYNELLAKEDLDAVLIATPHYDHTPIAIAAFEKGLSVLTEKPIAVHAQDAQKMIDAYNEAKKKHPGLVFGAMFQHRTKHLWKKVREMINNGELGKLVRTTWIITTWFRTQSYYDNGGWRATWEGEGGGALLNQCPHQLDLYQWLVGQPSSVTGFASFGKYHRIEVEDEVTGYLEHPNGMVGHFITSTGERPGTNRLEITAENGKVVVENNKLMFYKNSYSMLEEIKQAKLGFEKNENEPIEVEVPGGGGGHHTITKNFADVILNGGELIAEGVDGIHSLTIGNAITLSALENNRKIEMPFPQELYAQKLNELKEKSTFTKKEGASKIVDLKASY